MSRVENELRLEALNTIFDEGRTGRVDDSLREYAAGKITPAQLAARLDDLIDEEVVAILQRPSEPHAEDYIDEHELNPGAA